MKTVRVISPGWQERCRKLAQAHEEFEVKGFADEHVPFLEEICETHGYQMEETDTSMILLPSDSE